MSSCFKAYDIRGKVPTELNEKTAYQIGRAFSEEVTPKTVVVGHDVRESSPSLNKHLIIGLCDSGVNVLDIGLCGTEEIYFATSYLNADGGIMITASHNPRNYNGMKFVKKNSAPISGDSGLFSIRDMVEKNNFPPCSTKGDIKSYSCRTEYIKHLLTYISIEEILPLKLVVNSGNGCAGPIVDELEKYLPFKFEKIHHEPDGSFPHGIPNPLLPEKRQVTSDAVIAAGADMGIAWDGDFDRCFIYDEKGQFIEGYYIVGLLAEVMLKKNQKSKIIHDPRLEWNTRDIVFSMGGTPIRSKTGHAFIKERMRLEDAVYGGEMSAHHYFRDFFYCDSGMIPWLLLTELLSITKRPLSSLVADMKQAYPVSGEINKILTSPEEAINSVKTHYSKAANEIEYIDGISMNMGTWRFNLRKSNTEPLVRLNVEAKANHQLMEEKTQEILNLLKPYFKTKDV